ncbi:hypothetical protein RJT34_26381 [Clitoria ternatea]|uniref:Uncharacterized protein n=1 Tax=Clitoria ternatea TaxID=43366 RepID=A0AAN9FBR0_CLITE
MKAVKEIGQGFQMRLGDRCTLVWFEDWLRIGPLSQWVPFVHVTDSHLQHKGKLYVLAPTFSNANENKCRWKLEIGFEPNGNGRLSS